MESRSRAVALNKCLALATKGVPEPQKYLEERPFGLLLGGLAYDFTYCWGSRYRNLL